MKEVLASQKVNLWPLSYPHTLPVPLKTVLSIIPTLTYSQVYKYLHKETVADILTSVEQNRGSEMNQ